MTLYKILENGNSCHGGSAEWDLPKKDGCKWIPGAWVEATGPLVMCKNGIHLTGAPYRWYAWNCTCYEAEAEGVELEDKENTKCVARRARLIKPIAHPDWWMKAHRFVDEEIKAVPWLRADGKPLKKWKLFLAEDITAARDAARDAAYDAARDAAYHAAYDAAYDAACDAARDAARDAALYVLVGICAGCGLDPKHIKHAKDRWRVWQKGYGLGCEVNGVFYVYGVRQ
jgi:hypothetical protein